MCISIGIDDAILKPNNIHNMINFHHTNNDTIKNKYDTNYFTFTYSKSNLEHFSNFHNPFLSVLYSTFFNNYSNFNRCLRQPPNILRFLSQQNIYTIKKCNISRCEVCPCLIEAREFINIKGRFIYFNASMTCTTKNVVYYLVCRGCNTSDYVGETSTTLRKRMTLHRQHIRDKKYGFMKASLHIRSCANSNFFIIPIFKLNNESKWIRRQMEEFFRYNLNTNLNK